VLTGSITALVTPMLPDGEVDQAALEGLIDFHVESGTEALVIAGTTGESATLSTDEHIELIGLSCELAGERIPIIPGTGSNATAQTIELSKAAGSFEIAGLLVVTPYYNKPTQAGLVQHFEAIADAVVQPVLLYNVPGRTAVDMQVETVIRLAEHPNIVGIKEATGEVDRVAVIRDGAGDDFVLLSGDDATCREFMLAGGDGVISVTGNVVPAAMRELCDAATAGDAQIAAEIDAPLAGLHSDLFVESNPIPVKWALAEMGRIGSTLRLPLTPLAEHFHDRVSQAMSDAGVVW
jgi:4-hydroxy-tetrahydrodipicolinate synthase